MAALAAEGCTALTMAEVAAHLAAGRPFPPRAVAITFDDGFANLATAGAPVLARHGFPATVYMIAGMIGRTTQWSDHGRPLPAESLLTWPGIRALAAQGIEIGAHTVTHGFLSTYAPAALTHELADGRTMLETGLGRPVTAFAYPQGDYTPAVVRATRAAGYTTAVTMDQGRAGRTDDPWRLPRLYVGRNTSPATMRAFVVPTIGPTYRLLNLIIRRLPGRGRWPCPAPGTIQSTETVPGPDAP